MTNYLGMENPFKMKITGHLNQIKFRESFIVFSSIIIAVIMPPILGIWNLGAPRAQTSDLLSSMSWLIPRWFPIFHEPWCPVHVSNPNIMPEFQSPVTFHILRTSTCKFPFSAPQTCFSRAFIILEFAHLFPRLPRSKVLRLLAPLSFSHVSYPVPANPLNQSLLKAPPPLPPRPLQELPKQSPPSYSLKALFSAHQPGDLSWPSSAPNPLSGFPSVLSRFMRC